MTELNDFIIEQLKDIEFQKEYMNESLAEYINDGDFNAFFRSLELVIKSRDSISGFCEKAGIDRAMLYQIFNGERVPRVDTLAKILKTLGFNLKIEREIPFTPISSCVKFLASLNFFKCFANFCKYALFIF